MSLHRVLHARHRIEAQIMFITEEHQQLRHGGAGPLRCRNGGQRAGQLGQRAATKPRAAAVEGGAANFAGGVFTRSPRTGARDSR